MSARKTITARVLKYWKLSSTEYKQNELVKDTLKEILPSSLTFVYQFRVQRHIETSMLFRCWAKRKSPD